MAIATTLPTFAFTAQVERFQVRLYQGPQATSAYD